MLVLTGTASATDGGKGHDKDACQQGSATGDGTTSALGAPANKFLFNLCRTGPQKTDVTGYFQAAVVLSAGIVQVQGPVTCAVFDGKTVSFFYPFNDKSIDPTGLNGILIVATDGGPTPADDKLGFTIGPNALIGNCDFSTPQAQVARNVTALPLLEGQVVVNPPKKS